ncbi:MAG: DUF861 domain-containing protein [Fusobacterium sp.]|nr:DUF861 domain-containing protein [Fusobacterium sp.]
MNKELLEELIRKVVQEEMAQSQPESEYKQMDKSGVGVVKLNKMKKRVKMDTGNPKDQVTTTDLFTLQESERLGAGLMEMKETTFPWTLTYDEMDYIIEGRLEILIDGRKIVGEAGDVLFIPKNSKIEFSAPDYAKFMYFVYPANWSEL